MTMFAAFSATLTPDSSKLDSNFSDIEAVLKWFSAPGYTGASPKIAIDANGNMGATSPSSAVDRYVSANITAIGAIAIGVNNSGADNAFGVPTGHAYVGSVVMPVCFTANGLYAGKIDTLARFLFGATSAMFVGYKLQVDGGSTGGAVLKSGASGSECMVAWNATTSGNGVFANFGTEGSFTSRGSIDFNRGGTAVRYNTTSDARLKTNVKDAPAAGPLLEAFKVRSFDWLESGGHTEYQFVAQELHAVFPDAVKEGDSGESIEDVWAVDPSKLVGLLVKGWQEQQREIEGLRARLVALEGAA